MFRNNVSHASLIICYSSHCHYGEIKAFEHNATLVVLMILCILHVVDADKFVRDMLKIDSNVVHLFLSSDM